MSPWLGPIALFAAAAFAAFVIRRSYKRAEAEGAQLEHFKLNADDRLRVTLALRMLEDVDRELSKAAWIDGQPGNRAVGELLMDVKELQARMRQTLRNR